MDQPPKPARRILILAVACAAGVGLAAFILTSLPKPETVTVSFVCLTNDSGSKLCLFRGTNGTGLEILE